MKYEYAVGHYIVPEEIIKDSCEVTFRWNVKDNTFIWQKSTNDFTEATLACYALSTPIEYVAQVYYLRLKQLLHGKDSVKREAVCHFLESVMEEVEN